MLYFLEFLKFKISKKSKKSKILDFLIFWNFPGFPDFQFQRGSDEGATSWGLARPASLALLAWGLGFWHLGPGSWLGLAGLPPLGLSADLRRAFQGFR